MSKEERKPGKKDEGYKFPGKEIRRDQTTEIPKEREQREEKPVHKERQIRETPGEDPVRREQIDREEEGLHRNDPTPGIPGGEDNTGKNLAGGERERLERQNKNPEENPDRKGSGK